jgi:hypothetical protein
MRGEGGILHVSLSKLRREAVLLIYLPEVAGSKLDLNADWGCFRFFPGKS